MGRRRFPATQRMPATFRTPRVFCFAVMKWGIDGWCDLQRGGNASGTGVLERGHVLPTDVRRGIDGKTPGGGRATGAGSVVFPEQWCRLQVTPLPSSLNGKLGHATETDGELGASLPAHMWCVSVHRRGVELSHFHVPGMAFSSVCGLAASSECALELRWSLDNASACQFRGYKVSQSPTSENGGSLSPGINSRAIKSLRLSRAHCTRQLYANSGRTRLQKAIHLV